jgi:chromosome segregation ATPase
MDKLNKAIATGSKEFKELGAEVAYTSAGAVDVNKTFLNTVEALRRIEDPAKRAELASKTLGKGWQDMSELIAQGSNRLEDSLASVSDAKVINQEELERARQFRDSLDQLTDKGGDLAMTLGGALLPVLADLLGVLNTVITTVEKTAGAIQDFMSGIGGRGLENLVDMAKTQEELNTHLKESWSAYYSSRRAAERLAAALYDTTHATEEADEAWQELLGSLSEQEAWNDVLDALDDVHKASYEALVSGTAEDARRAQGAVNDLTGDIYDYVQSLGNIPPDVQTKIVALLERGAFDEAIALLNNIRSGATAVIVGTVSGIPVGPGETPSEVRPPTMRTPAKIPTRPIAGAYSAVNINVAGSVIAENDLVETVRKGLVNAQRNGAGLVYTNR